MKRSGIQLALVITAFICLLTLLGIQVIWISKSARMQEAQFNRSVTMAMNRIVDNLSNDRMICNEVTNCLRNDAPESCYLMMKNREEWANMGKMIKSDLQASGINLDFEFDIVSKKEAGPKNTSSNVYFTNGLEEALDQSGYELRLRFPEKGDFIKAQIGFIFITSIILLILVSVSFILIFRFYRREKILTASIVDIMNNMTHEFRTPLTNIGLANNMISRTDPAASDEKISRYTNVIKTEHQKLMTRVNEILNSTFSETFEGKMNEPIQVNEIVEEVVDSFRLRIETINGTISLARNAEQIVIKGNTDQFRTMLVNLLDNAVKYSGDNPVIAATVTRQGNNAKIVIADSGIGISKEFRTQIFRKYYRVPSGDVFNNDGFGLGLYQVYKTVKNMKGTISVESNGERGSRFVIEFPVFHLNIGKA